MLVVKKDREFCRVACFLDYFKFKIDSIVFQYVYLEWCLIN